MLGHRYGFIGAEYDGQIYKLKAFKGSVRSKTFEGEAEEEDIFTLAVSSGRIYLRLELRLDKNYFLSYSENGTDYTTVNHIFPLERATWIGAKLAIWAGNRRNNDSSGFGDFDYIHIK